LNQSEKLVGKSGFFKIVEKALLEAAPALSEAQQLDEDCAIKKRTRRPKEVRE